MPGGARDGAGEGRSGRCRDAGAGEAAEVRGRGGPSGAAHRAPRRRSGRVTQSLTNEEWKYTVETKFPRYYLTVVTVGAPHFTNVNSPTLQM